jgi:hypothetical protein
MSCALQSWGNYIQMSQAVMSYATAITMLVIYTWFGHELTKQVIYILKCKLKFKHLNCEYPNSCIVLCTVFTLSHNFLLQED